MKLLILLATLALAATPPACSAPPPAQPPAPPSTVTFHAEVLNAQAELLRKRVALTITGIQVDGSVANVIDPANGQIRPGPEVLYRTTPTTYAFTMGPGVVSASFTVDYLGLGGEIVQCYAVAGGVEVDREATQVRAIGSGGRGHAVATCLYTGS